MQTYKENMIKKATKIKGKDIKDFDCGCCIDLANRDYINVCQTHQLGYSHLFNVIA